MKTLKLFILMAGLTIGTTGTANGPDPATQQLINDLGLKESVQPVRQSGLWKKPRRIVVLLDERRKLARPDAEIWLKEVAGDAEIVFVPSSQAAVESLNGADVLLGICTHESLEAGKSLRYILNYSAGIDRCTSSPLAGQRDLLVTNMKRIYGPGIAEHTIAMMYSLTRKMHIWHERQLDEFWDRSAVKRSDMWEVQGRTMFVVGLGGIGTEIARRASALGMKVIATRNSSRKGPDFVSYVGLSGELQNLAAQADVVVNAAPLTTKTRGMFNKTIFSAMKKGSYFINVGRGKSVVTEDLVEALESGHLGGAALDVVDPEPLPQGHELWEMPNVIITPHISAGSDAQMNRFWLLVRENLRRYVNGGKMLNVVDLKRGY
jgi:phosphoglycerate dehydrogenase-like enzyme